jgi:hypothetical protein
MGVWCVVVGRRRRRNLRPQPPPPSIAPIISRHVSCTCESTRRVGVSSSCRASCLSLSVPCLAFCALCRLACLVFVARCGFLRLPCYAVLVRFPIDPRGAEIIVAGLAENFAQNRTDFVRDYVDIDVAIMLINRWAFSTPTVMPK